MSLKESEASLDPPEPIRVGFSVEAKLLAGVVALLVVIIAFLSTSTILLFKKDKRAYIYQSQAVTAVLVGKEAEGLLRRGMDTTRVALSAVDRRQSVEPRQAAALKALMQNQTAVSRIELLRLQTSTYQAASLVSVSQKNAKIAPFVIAPEWLKTSISSLLRDGYAFLNLSASGGPPLAGVLVADLGLKDDPGGLPVAVGAVPLQGLARGLKGLDVTIATRDGWVIYDTRSARLYGRANVSDDPLFDRARESQAASGAAEYDRGGKRILGSYANPGLGLSALVRTEWRKATQATYELTGKLLLLGAMAIGVAVVFGVFFSKTITAPINKLYQATFDVAKGNFSLDLKPASRDEVGALTASFNRMSRQIGDLVLEKLKKVAMENELAIASTVQQTLIPSPRFQDEKILIRSHYQSASQCGGDWWGFFGVGNRVCMVIADATGHGFPSALITASARSCFTFLHKLSRDRGQLGISPVKMLHYANRVVYEASAGKIMMTMFLGVIDFDTRTLTFANAGHNPPWLFRFENGAYKLDSLTACGHRLGDKAETAEFEQRVVSFSEKDILFLYTDGLTEGTAPDGQMYGKKRARRAIEAHLGAGPDAVVEGLLKDFAEHSRDKPLDDDVTIAAAMFYPPPPAQGPS